MPICKCLKSRYKQKHRHFYRSNIGKKIPEGGKSLQIHNFTTVYAFEDYNPIFFKN